MPIYRDTILCEIIRPEANNKLSLFGVFGESIFLPQIPTILGSLAILQRWAPTKEEQPGTKFQMSFEVSGPAMEPIRFDPYDVVVPGPPRPLIQVAFQIQAFKVTVPGDYEIVTFVNRAETHRFVFTITVPDQQQPQQHLV